VDEGLDLVAAHDIATDAHHRLLHEIPKLAAVTIHVSPQASAGTDHHEVLENHQKTL
jgi:divalent metal cation (Fe/Co/Zn/Cd) transporter